MEITEEIQPEMKDIIEAISRWVVVNGNEVSFVGSFVAFDKNMDVKDGAERIFAYGDQEVLQIQLDELRDAVKKDKDEFVNW